LAPVISAMRPESCPLMLLSPVDLRSLPTHVRSNFRKRKINYSRG
jgi:hypothetical protein